MCYSNCKYERQDGECKLNIGEMRKRNMHFPYDAECIDITDEEIKQLEEENEE